MSHGTRVLVNTRNFEGPTSWSENNTSIYLFTSTNQLTPFFRNVLTIPATSALQAPAGGFHRTPCYVTDISDQEHILQPAAGLKDIFRHNFKPFLKRFGPVALKKLQQFANESAFPYLEKRLRTS